MLYSRNKFYMKDWPYFTIQVIFKLISNSMGEWYDEDELILATYNQKRW